MNSTAPAFDIASMQISSLGDSVAETVEAIFAGISVVNDPGIFIHVGLEGPPGRT